jgi:hypothetical protein
MPRRDAKEKAAESAQGYNGKCVLFQPHHPRTALHCGATQQHTAAAACTPCLEAQPAVPSESVQAPNANSSSLSGMFTVVATICQHIMMELSGAESEEDRIMTITKIALKLVKQNGR